MVASLCTILNTPRLFAAWDINRGLALPQKSYMALIQFLQLCKKKSTSASTASHSTPSSTATTLHDASADTIMTDIPTTAAAHGTDPGQSTTDVVGGGASDDGGDVYSQYSALLECGLVREAGGELLEVALEALLELATDPPGRWDVAAERWVRGHKLTPIIWCLGPFPGWRGGFGCGSLTGPQDMAAEWRSLELIPLLGWLGPVGHGLLGWWALTVPLCMHEFNAQPRFVVLL